VKQGKPEKRVVIGYDKRFHSENFAAAAAEVLAANGFMVSLTKEATPTPGYFLRGCRQKSSWCN
jgi:phosphomannomutase